MNLGVATTFNYKRDTLGAGSCTAFHCLRPGPADGPVRRSPVGRRRMISPPPRPSRIQLSVT